MKIKGKVKDLVDMLNKAGCNGIFDPVTFEIKEDTIFTNIIIEGNLGNLTATFTSFDIELEDGEEKIVVDTLNLLEQVEVMKSDDDFVLTRDAGTLEIVTDKETVKFHLDSDLGEKSGFSDKVLFKKSKDDEEEVYWGKAKLDNIFKTTVGELSELVKRKSLTSVDYIIFDVEGDEVIAYIGDYDSQRYTPRKYKLNVNMEKSNDGKTQISLGIDDMVKVLNGHIKVYMGEGTPMSFYSETDKAKVVYTFPPAKDR